MRALIFFLIMPLVAFSNDSDQLDLSYSMQGETLVMTWSGDPSIAKYVIKSGTEIDDEGNVQYETLEVVDQRGDHQFTYSDERSKPATIIYYQVIAYNANGQEISNTAFTANFVNKDKYTVNINPNFFSKILDFEVNTKTDGKAMVTIEELAGEDKIEASQLLQQGYNSFSMDISDLKSNKLVVKIDHNDKIIYRLLEVEKEDAPAIITSDE